MDRNATRGIGRGGQRAFRRLSGWQRLESRQLLAIDAVAPGESLSELLQLIAEEDQQSGGGAGAGADSAAGSSAGFFAPQLSTLFLSQRNGQGLSDVTLERMPTDVQPRLVVGDWDGDGRDGVGYFDSRSATWYLYNALDSPQPDLSFTYGPVGTNWIPLAGDWDGNGRDGVGFYDSTNAQWFLKNTLLPGLSDHTFAYGRRGAGWRPLVGDWDGNGSDGVGFYDSLTSQWFLKNHLAQGVSDVEFFYGPTGNAWTALVGDWNADGRDTPGFYDPAASQWFLKNIPSQGLSDQEFFYGPAGTNWLALAGDWDGSIARPANGNLALSVPGQPGQRSDLTLSYTANGARFRNEVGGFLVDDRQGRIGNLYPGDPGYVLAALTHPTRQVLFTGTDRPGHHRTWSLASGQWFAMYLIQDRSSAEYLQLNPTGNPDAWPPAYFSFPAANPGGQVQMKYLGSDLFRWEDKGLDGDRDFDDFIGRYQFSTPRAPSASETLGVTLDLVAADDTVPLGDLRTEKQRVGLTGLTAPGAWVRLVGTDASVQADSAGRFYFADRPLTEGANAFRVLATDAAGRLGRADLVVTHEAPPTPPPSLAGLAKTSPANGEELVSLTRETIVYFDEPVDPDSVTSDNVYLFARGARVPATLRVSATERFVTLFPRDPLPASTQIRLTVDGSTIRGRDGQLLDADGDGAPGGVLTADYRTLPLAFIPGTAISGRVLDSYNRAADGSDRPVVGARISLDADPRVFAVTDSDGRFTLTSTRGLPAPEFFVHIDGSTATNAPPGTVYATLGKPFHTVPGQATQLAMNGEPFDIYLPPMAAGDVVPLGVTTDTVVGLGAFSQAQVRQMFPPDTAQQVIDALQVTYPAGSAQDERGRLANRAVVIPVEPDRLPAPLPSGVAPELVISVQAGTAAGFNLAGGSTNFDVPAPITFPNLSQLAPGEQALLWSFDHDAGKWTVVGTGTVSADGRRIESDPGVGILAPGWHFVDPGNCAGSGGAPPMTGTPTQMMMPDEHYPQPLIIGESGSLMLGPWRAPGQTSPPSGDCSPPEHAPGTSDYLMVQIDIDGPISDYMKQKPGTTEPLQASTSFTLIADSGDERSFGVTAKSFQEMAAVLGGTAAAPFSQLNENRLYGSTITVTETRKTASDNKETVTKKIYYLYRFIDATDADHDDGRIEFEDTLAGVGITRQKEIALHAGATPLRWETATPFSVSPSTTSSLLTFSPTLVQLDQTGTLTLKVAQGPLDGFLGNLRLSGDGEPKQAYSVDVSSLLNPDDFLDALSNAFASNMNASEQAIFGKATVSGGLAFDDAKALAFIQDVLTEAGTLLAMFSPATALASSGNVIVFDDFEYDSIIDGSLFEAPPWGTAFIVDASNGQFNIHDIYMNLGKYSDAEKAFRLSEALNEQQGGHVDIYVDQYFAQRPTVITSWTRQQLVRSLGKTIAHEFGHNIGMPHTNKFDPNDVMAQGEVLGAQRTFGTSSEGWTIALGLDWRTSDAVAALNQYFIKAKAAGYLPPADGPIPAPEDPDGIPLEPIGGPLIWLRDASNSNYLRVVEFGAVTLGESRVMSMQLFNGGDTVANLSDAALSAPEFRLLTPLPTTLAIGGTIELAVEFIPTELRTSTAVLSIQSDALNADVSVSLTGYGRTNGQRAELRPLDNVFPGQTMISNAPPRAVASITSAGSQPITIMQTRVIGGAGFELLNPVTLDRPVVLSEGQSLELDARFSPKAVGLQRTLIEVHTSDVNRPVQTISVSGTGLPDPVYPLWGRDYVAIEFPNRPELEPQRAVSNAAGDFSFIIPPNEVYHTVFFDPETGLVAHGYGRSPRSGRGVDLTSSIVFGASTAPDADGDGLPDDIEFAIGSRTDQRDSDGDGIDDFAEVEQGFNPTGGGAVTGVVGTVELTSDVQAVAVAPNRVYAATGSLGLAVFDVSEFGNPILLGELDLTGTASDVAADVSRPEVVVAAGATLHVVDVSDPVMPQLVRSITAGANLVEVAEGFAWAASGRTLSVVDLATGDVVQRINVGQAGSISALSREDQRLYVFVGGPDTLQVYDISIPEQTQLLGQANVPVVRDNAGLHVGNDLAWVAGGGLVSVDVSDPAQPLRIADRQTLFPSRRLALNGSGLALVAPESDSTLSLYRVSDPTDTDNFVAGYPLATRPRDVAIGNGRGYVAAGKSLLEVNYLAYDTLGQPPTVAIEVAARDEAPLEPGLQVLENSRLAIRAVTADDVQVRLVEFLVDGQVVATDSSFPFDLVLQARQAQGPDDMLRLQVRAIDTGGNANLSDELLVDLVPDTTSPLLENVLPAEGGRLPQGRRVVRARFSEPVQTDLLNTPGAISILGAGLDNLFDTADDVSVGFTLVPTSDPALLSLRTEPMAPGLHQLRLNRAQVLDLSGNPLAGTGPFVASGFEVVQFSGRLVGNPPTVLYVVDVSGSTSSKFGPEGSIGDLNGDGDSDTILDAEIAGLLILNQELINLGYGDTARVGLIAFDSSAELVDMNPTDAGILAVTTPMADLNQNGRPDVEEAALTLRFGGGTNYGSALRRAIETFDALGTPGNQSNLIFLSDGEDAGSDQDRVSLAEQLRTRGAGLVAYGAGGSAKLADLQEIDSKAAVFTSLDELIELFLALSGNPQSQSEAAPRSAASADAVFRDWTE